MACQTNSWIFYCKYASSKMTVSTHLCVTRHPSFVARHPKNNKTQLNYNSQFTNQHASTKYSPWWWRSQFEFHTNSSRITISISEWKSWYCCQYSATGKSCEYHLSWLVGAASPMDRFWYDQKVPASVGRCRILCRNKGRNKAKEEEESKYQ
jgi:hypothetical protein